MRTRSPILRVSIGIALLTMTLLLTADLLFGLSTEGMRPQLMARKHLAETLAVQYSDLAARGDLAAMKTAMDLLVERNPEVLSTAVRRADGSLLAEGGDHRRFWRGAPVAESTDTHARVPIFEGARRWGTLEIRFTEITVSSLSALLGTAWFRLLCFVGLVGSLMYFVYMRRTLRHLDPAAVIPARVKAAFDVLAEGVAFVDRDERIVLANRMFSTLTGRGAPELMGVALSSLGWSRHAPASDESGAPPWLVCIHTGRTQTGVSMVLRREGTPTRTFTVNAAPVLDDTGRARGAIVTFDDVTELEGKKQELERAVVELRQSQDRIRQQNEKLEIMATRDALTNCLNRRSFMEALEREVSRARRDGAPLSCIMFDIDHFKSVNDTFGHAVGDDAIRFVAGVAHETIRGFDIVCRYGGEEFCVLLPMTNLDGAWEVSERIREAVMKKSAPALPQLKGRTLTVSLGIADLDSTVRSPADLVDRADGALYSSKSNGRNCSSLAREAVDAAAAGA